jgi:hypothetical protein
MRIHHSDIKASPLGAHSGGTLDELIENEYE